MFSSLKDNILIIRLYLYMYYSYLGKIFNLIKGMFVILNDFFFFLNCINFYKK